MHHYGRCAQSKISYDIRPGENRIGPSAVDKTEFTELGIVLAGTLLSFPDRDFEPKKGLENAGIDSGPLRVS